jgi:predicted GNAT family acetyltransferase
MEIRKANIDDLEVLLKTRLEFVQSLRNHEVTLSEEFHKSTYDYMKKHIEDDTMVIWMAIDNIEIVSAAMVCYYQLLPTISNETGNTGYILNVFTDPNYRRQGLATELMNKLKQDAKERNVSRLLLNATDMGKLVYEKLGYKEVTKQMVLEIS